MAFSTRIKEPLGYVMHPYTPAIQSQYVGRVGGLGMPYRFSTFAGLGDTTSAQTDWTTRFVAFGAGLLFGAGAVVLYRRR